MLWKKVQFPTTKPIETIDKCIEFFSKFEDLVGLAIGSFGPIDIDPNSNTYGFITTTPKPNWANVDIVGAFRRALNVPIYFTTGVNSSAYGEVVARNNAGGHIENLVYYTIGTGIGAGVIQRGEFIGELGTQKWGTTMWPNTQWMWKKNSRVFVLSTMAVWKVLRLVLVSKLVQGIRGENIELNSNVWDIQAYYIAQAAVNATVTFRPDVVVFGGGVMAQQHMLDRVRTKFTALLKRLPPCT